MSRPTMLAVLAALALGAACATRPMVLASEPVPQPRGWPPRLPAPTTEARERIDAVESICGEAPVSSAFRRGSLLAAARSVAAHARPHFGVVAAAPRGAAGAAQLACGLDRAGFPIRIAAAGGDAEAVHAALALTCPDAGVALDAAAGDPGAIAARWLRASPPISHLVVIAPAGGPAEPPLAALLSGGPWLRIAFTAPTLPADAIPVCGVASRGGPALLLALAALRPDLAAPLTAGLSPEVARALSASSGDVHTADSEGAALGRMHAAALGDYRRSPAMNPASTQ